MNANPVRALALTLLAIAPAASADQTPESVAVVVNGDSWASVTIANEYARLREIPDCNVIMLTNLSAFDSMDIDRFRGEVLGPVLDEIASRDLGSQIDCIVYSVDLPTAVHVGADVRDTPLPRVITPVASANGLTYLHEWVMRKDPDYLRLDINRYSRRALPLPDGEPLAPAEAAEYQRGMELYAARDFAAATKVIAALADTPRDDPSFYYNLACCQALVGENDAAMGSLRRAAAIGWRDAEHTAADTDLASLEGRADFRSLLAEMRARRVEVQPSRGFRSSIGWDATGEPSESGPHYMLSATLGVTSGRGNSVEEVMTCLRRASGADGTMPRGSVYFLRNGDVRSTTRAWGFADAAAQLGALGVRGTVEDGVLPRDRRDVAGAVIGTATFDWTSSGSLILPGAIVEHLTSCGGMMGERDTQTPCTDLIRAGAAGTSGAVTEPYALQAKFPNPFMHLHYARGSTLAEAFYQSLEGPYQLLIIGDPLCRPWGRRGSVSASGIARNATLRGVVDFRPVISGGNRGVESVVVFLDGRPVVRGAAGEPVSLDTSLFADGEHTLTLVAVHDDALGSRDRGTIPVRFENSGRGVTLASRPRERAAFGERVSLDVAAPGAKGIEVTHLGRVVGSLSGEGGSVEIESALLGLGSVTLRVIARYDGAGPRTTVFGPAITIEITPARLRGRPPARGGLGSPGLALTMDQRATQTVTDTFGPDWLGGAAIEAGEAFELSGVFESEGTDLWQVQVRTNTGAVVEIDGVAVASAADGGWRYAPAQLSPGPHRLRVAGRGPVDGSRASMELRLGSAGTRCPSEGWFVLER